MSSAFHQSVTINPSSISGTVIAPPSKSAMQRACALALLHNGETIITNSGTSNDDLAALNIIKQLGATVTPLDNNKLSILGVFQVSPQTDGGGLVGALDVAESGLSLRMFTPIAALSDKEITITGSGSLLTRPIDLFQNILPKLAVSVKTNNGKLPITIKGPLKPKDITIDGSQSSQYLTGLLMAFAKVCTEPVTIKVINLTSKPYIDLTLQMMKHFGWNIKNDDYKEFHFDPIVLKASPTGGGLVGASIEGDWSSASFLLVASAIAGEITVKGLRTDSSQADKQILQVLEKAGAIIKTTEDTITVAKAELRPFTFDATDCPDLFPPLVALAAYCKGTSTIIGADRLKHKESDRASTLKKEFSKMGIQIDIKNNTIRIKGGTVLQAEVSSHNDHRIAMSCAIAALGATGPVIIHNAEAVNKSYPEFFISLSMLSTKAIGEI